MLKSIVRLLFLLVATSTVASQAHAAKRLALVIGNSQYLHTQRLANPESDARLISSILRKQGFEVLNHQNLNFKAMKRAIKAYTSKLEAYGKDTVGLIFYAGHGLQSAGRNYLVPIDAQIEKEGDVEIETISSQALLSGVQFAGNRLNIIILDACRNNPYRGVFRSPTRGFARMDAPIGSLVAFSTAPGTVAADGGGVNSPYTTALAKAMVEPGLKIEEVFKRARATVYSATGGKQVPWESSSIFGDFFFANGKATSEAKPAKAPTNPAVQAWNAIEDTESTAVLEAFIKEFSESVYAKFAKARLAELKIAQEQKVAVGAFPDKSKPAAHLNIEPPKEFQDCPVCPKMVVLPAGSFLMGSPKGEKGRRDDEPAQRVIRIDKPFAVGKFEVTFAEWDACGRNCSNRSQDEGWGRGRRPVIGVSWDDARGYVRWLSRKTGKSYRLLTESEWEYAARAGTTTAFSTGQTITTDQANIDDYRKRTLTVGSFPSNRFGLHDMHGNVKEWLADCWVVKYDPGRRAADSCNWGYRSLRGGSWYDFATSIRSSARSKGRSDTRAYDIGFRVARDLSP